RVPANQVCRDVHSRAQRLRRHRRACQRSGRRRGHVGRTLRGAPPPGAGTRARRGHVILGARRAARRAARPRARQPSARYLPRGRVPRLTTTLGSSTLQRALPQAGAVRPDGLPARRGRRRHPRLEDRGHGAPRSGRRCTMSTLRERSPVAYALAGPVTLWMGAALVVPTLFIVWVSLWATRTFSAANPLGVVNYVRFFHRPAYLKVLSDTVEQ